MKENIQFVKLQNISTQSGKFIDEIELSYQIFGSFDQLNKHGVLIIHALTGNSNVGGEDGWWNSIVGRNKAINTDIHPVIAFNVPGNGYDGTLLSNFEEFNAGEVADLFIEGLKTLSIDSLFAVVGGSLGGGISWHLAVQHPRFFKKIIPIATHFQASDWVIAMSKIQKELLKIEKDPVQIARKMAMLFYRTPESYQSKFSRTKGAEKNVYNVDSYLDYQGEKLNNRFALEAYKTMNYVMSTIDIAYLQPLELTISRINAEVHIVGVNSDLLFTSRESKRAFEQLQEQGKFVRYYEIDSIHGHDAFLIENEQLNSIFSKIFSAKADEKHSEEQYKVLKFGGKSLSNNYIENVLKIIENESEDKKVYVVLSARSNATEQLEDLLNKALRNDDFSQEIKNFENEQRFFNCRSEILDEYFNEIRNILDGVKLIGDYTDSLRDKFLAFGELISVETVSLLLKNRNKRVYVNDVRKWLKTDSNFGKAQVYKSLSYDLFNKQKYESKDVRVELLAGFIASDLDGKTTTLGRNGSNYSAAILASFINAEEMQNWTHVDGIYSADPSLVKSALQIELLSYNEANELANFGTQILHAKTIIPLIEKDIPLRILNTTDYKNKGTLINRNGNGRGVKAVTVLEDVALISLTGRGLLGNVGIDGRIFGVLMRNNISIRNISQASSERGVGFIVDIVDANKALELLRDEFKNEIAANDINEITARKDVSVVSVIGNYLEYFDKIFSALKKNRLEPILFNNSINGNNLSIIINDKQTKRAVNVIHSHIFGAEKTLNIAVIGKGLVGSTLINQINSSRDILLEKRNIKINVFAIADTKRLLLNASGINENWKDELAARKEGYELEELFSYAEENNLENLVGVDVTASKDFVHNYFSFVERGFDLVSANKIANTLSYDFYARLRSKLKKYRKKYLYETNVGAGLPLVATISQLHHSGDRVKKIRGIFSGSLSYIFNNFSENGSTFSKVLLEAKEKGFTEPDPREDLSGNDVARKLLILAREIDMKNEFEEVKINNLIPESLENVTYEDFFTKLDVLDEKFNAIKSGLKEGEVLRYVGELNDNGDLLVDLITTPKNSSLGQIKGADSIFEIFTESYGDEALVVQGAGAGAEVTARGVYGDLMKLV